MPNNGTFTTSEPAPSTGLSLCTYAGQYDEQMILGKNYSRISPEGETNKGDRCQEKHLLAAHFVLLSSFSIFKIRLIRHHVLAYLTSSPFHVLERCLNCKLNYPKCHTMR